VGDRRRGTLGDRCPVGEIALLGQFRGVGGSAVATDVVDGHRGYAFEQYPADARVEPPGRSGDREFLQSFGDTQRERSRFGTDLGRLPGLERAPEHTDLGRFGRRERDFDLGVVVPGDEP
jgi:hypothetical protein